jgi:hypothetical protein
MVLNNCFVTEVYIDLIFRIPVRFMSAVLCNRLDKGIAEGLEGGFKNEKIFKYFAFFMFIAWLHDN